MKVPDHREILQERFSERMSANPLYSLRAFARDLQMLPQSLSHVMSGKKGLSKKSALKIAKRLGMNQNETDYFCTLVESKCARSKINRKLAEAKLATFSEQNLTTTTLTLDLFRVISDWHHFGLVELLRIAGSKRNDTRWMAKRLGIQESEIKLALDRLLRLELVSKLKSGYAVNQTTLLTTDGVPSDALRKFHDQVLEKAQAAIRVQTVDERYLSTSFMPINSKNLLKAKKMIQEFRQQFIQNNSQEEGDQVYALSMQFFKLTQELK